MMEDFNIIWWQQYILDAKASKVYYKKDNLQNIHCYDHKSKIYKQ